MSIKVSNLTKKINRRTILDNVNMTVNVGEIVGFLGPNGAGKTTTLKIIAGALDFKEGEVEVCGENVKTNRIQTSGKIGYLPEHNALYEDMYIREYLLFVAELRLLPDAKKAVTEIIQKLGLIKESRKKISELSKGWKQRIGIAQALLSDPEVLILDEPTSGLDPMQMDEIRQLIREIGKDRTVILSSHNMQEVKELCSRAIIINEGRIVANIDNTSSLERLKEGSSTYFFEFEQAMSETLIEAEFPEANLIRKISDTSYAIGSEIDIRKRIFEIAVREKNAILTLTKATRDLEDIFREYTKY